ncbi:hypothetical protein SeMB42_g07300 [Synchytrium endobioticum]|uniref:Uncharacterized protein n=1 Tax=Synchytrium endobioticum TaxID=286115 RepID=A0A507C5G0_9FUNG|nr:hypothetical protein SeMB42_g07300 [Synchytrium endobioticum]
MVLTAGGDPGTTAPSLEGATPRGPFIIQGSGHLDEQLRRMSEFMRQVAALEHRNTAIGQELEAIALKPRGQASHMAQLKSEMKAIKAAVSSVRDSIYALINTVPTEPVAQQHSMEFGNLDSMQLQLLVESLVRQVAELDERNTAIGLELEASSSKLEHFKSASEYDARAHFAQLRLELACIKWKRALIGRTLDSLMISLPVAHQRIESPKPDSIGPARGNAEISTRLSLGGVYHSGDNDRGIGGASSSHPARARNVRLSKPPRPRKN